MGERKAPVIGVVGSTGGVGASALACAIAGAAAGGLLVDLDTYGGGLDIALGIDRIAGARWSGLRVAGGALDPVDLSRGLPRWRGVAVLAADGVAPSLAAMRAVIEAGEHLGPVVLDVGRCLCADVVEVLDECSLVVLVTEADQRGISAARAVAATLTAGRVGIVLRRGVVGTAEVEALVGLPVLGTLPPTGRRGGIRPPRGAVRVAAGLLEGVVDG